MSSRIQDSELRLGSHYRSYQESLLNKETNPPINEPLLNYIKFSQVELERKTNTYLLYDDYLKVQHELTPDATSFRSFVDTLHHFHKVQTNIALSAVDDSGYDTLEKIYFARNRLTQIINVSTKRALILQAITTLIKK